MKFSSKDIYGAAEQGVLPVEQARALIATLNEKYASTPRFSLGHVIYYFGALLIMSAMTWHMVRAWESLGGGGIFALSSCYIALFASLGAQLWKRPHLKIPGGLLITTAVSIVPLAVYGLQRWTGLWIQSDPGTYHDFYVWIRGGWFSMEMATIIAGLLAIRFFRFPFITFPVAFALWFMSMDLAPLITGASHLTWDLRYYVSIYFGLAMVLGTYLVDRRTKKDFAFWGYLFGMASLWGGLTCLDSSSELSRFAYCMLNVFFIFLSVFLSRKVFIVFGTMGVITYLGHLSEKVFADAVMFPIAVSTLGLVIIGLGILYQKHQARIEATLVKHLPEPLRKLRPVER